MPDPTFLTRDGGDPVAHFESLFNRFYHPSEESLMTAALVLREGIRERSLSGVSFDGSPFAPYSPAYAARKGQENVDLYGKNEPPHMLDVLGVRVNLDPPSIDIGIFDEEKVAIRAEVHNEGGATNAGRKAGKYKSLKARRTAIASGKLGQIPARPWLGLDGPSLDRAGESIVQDIGRV